MRLTSDPEPDVSPAWSPDGRSIAFLRVIGDGKADVLLMSSASPGPLRKLATVGVPLPTEDLHIHLTFLAWSPDGRWIAVSDGEAMGGLVLLSVETGEYRRMTFPPSDYTDFSPAFSPNMDRLAFIRFSGSIAGDLYSLKLSGDGKAVGEPERLTFYNRQITSPVWTKDGRALLFVRHEVAGTPSFWRVQIGGKRRVEALPIPADSSFTLTLSARGDKIVYTRDSETVNIWAAELDAQHHVRRMRRQIASTWAEGNPQFSPDGRRIAYQSLQSGRLEIWVCDRDGSHPRQLTLLGAAVSGFPRWSPDGKKIVFHSRPKTLASLYLIDAEGGKPQRITGESENDISPSWSHDGKWIYFASTRAGQQYIWKMPATGGAEAKISGQSGWCPLESRDGRFVYYMSSSGSALRALPLSGGPEIELLSGVVGTSYAPANDGIYFIRAVDHDRNRELAFFDFASRSISVLARIEKPVWLGLAVSPGEDLLLYSQVDRRVSNLMLVEDFH
ncbi:MAG: DPP IV N-terminal domain-containing protein [Bryobacteraceae bacterium]